jgi:hypothetical protein
MLHAADSGGVHPARVLLRCTMALSGSAGKSGPGQSLVNGLRLSTVARWNDWAFESDSGKKTLQVEGDFQANGAAQVLQCYFAALGSLLSSSAGGGSLPTKYFFKGQLTCPHWCSRLHCS